MSTRSVFAITVLMILLGGNGPSIAPAHAETTVDFAVPLSVPVTIAGVNDKGDHIVITGQPAGATDATGCAVVPGDYPVQDAVVIDPGGNRATRLSGFIVTYPPATTLAPSTKIADVNAIGPCTAGGIDYMRYRGTVE